MLFSCSKKILLFNSLILMTLLSSCGNKKVPAVGYLSQSNLLLKGKELLKSGDKKSLHIRKDAMGHLFIMSHAIISSAPTPTGRAQANKIVFFKRENQSLFMFQSKKGLVSTDSVDTMILLAEFPILVEDDDYIGFDFKKGMNTLFQKGSYYIESDKKAASNDDAIKITHSYLKKVEVRTDYLFVDQILRLEATVSGQTTNIPAEVKYTFSSYKKNEKFTPKVSDGIKRVGYFQNHKVITAGSGEENVYIKKFDFSEKKTFFLTKDIPKEFRKAVVDGVLYWNNVFKKEVLEVKTLPEGISVHEPKHNIIQWMKWDTAGFAYADTMSDPLTGEVIQANVYLTSVFGISGLKRAKKILQNIKIQKDKIKNKTKLSLLDSKNDTNSPELQINLKHNHFTKVCDTTKFQNLIKNDFKNSVNKILNLNKSDKEKEAIFLRFSQDYIRKVVAHEVGHNLGLRHNFAGNMTSTITPKNIEKVTKDYLIKDILPDDLVVASTVMDYERGVLASLIGAHIRKRTRGFTYDNQAIEFGYTDKKAEEINFNPFCSDDLARSKKTYVDCKIFDTFPNNIEGNVYMYQKAYKDLALKIVKKFSFLKEDSFEFGPVTKKELEKNQNKIKLSIEEKINKIRFSPEEDVLELLKEKVVPMLLSFHKESRYLFIEHNYPKKTNAFEKDEIKLKTKEFISSSLNNVGGYTKAYLNDLRVIIKKNQAPTVLAIAKFKQLAFSYLLNNFQKEIGTLPEEQQHKILNKLTKYFDRFEKEFLVYNFTILPSMKFYKKEKDFEKTIFNITAPMLLSKTNEVLMTLSNNYQIKTSAYDFKKESKEKNLRQLGAKLLAHNFFPNRGSYIKKMKEIRKQVIIPLMTDQLMATMEATNSGSSDELEDWTFLEAIVSAPLISYLKEAFKDMQEAEKEKEKEEEGTTDSIIPNDGREPEGGFLDYSILLK